MLTFFKLNHSNIAIFRVEQVLKKIDCRQLCITTNRYNINSGRMKYLNVAEKNDAAKTIAGHLSRGTSRRREGLSPYNKIYEFQANINGREANMVMTSVSGHLLTYEFLATYRNWRGCDPLCLFDAPVRKTCPENFTKVKDTLEREIRACSGLIIWTDCDREGENIGFEIINVCQAIKRNITVYRAKFSEMTATAVKRALSTLSQPDEKQSQAVDIRSELDLRIGAAFTRFQTLRFQRLFPSQLDKRLVSYGSCQIPTLGFVTQRFKENENFIPQTFWKLKLTHTIESLTVEFNWARHRLFDKQCCEAFLMVCQLNPNATVDNVILKSKSKWRPLPMDTIALEKLGSKWLKISAKQIMTIAEKLYTKGIISYPRTETNIFSNTMDLKPLVEQQNAHPNWGEFANKVLQWGPNPRAGKKSDQAHPPIHPTKFVNDLAGDEKKVYELVVRHFLACVSKDATGSETIINVRVADEEFTATGLCIHERNYLEVYIYEKWNAKEVHPYQIGDTFLPTELTMPEGTTTAPSLLTEAELIALMDKHGIGTDATHAEHINTIKEREYIGVIDRGLLVPGILGMGLVEGYDAIDLPLAQPKLRAALERDLKAICTGERDPQVVLQEQISVYKEAFRIMTERAKKMDESLASRLQTQPIENSTDTAVVNDSFPTQFKEIFKCPKCEMPMLLKVAGNSNKYVVSCAGYPQCKNAFWLSEDIVKEAIAVDQFCPKCGSPNKLVNLKMKRTHMLSVLNQTQIDGTIYKTCFVCDASIRNLCDIAEHQVKCVVNIQTNNREQSLAHNSSTSVTQRRLPTHSTTERPSMMNRLHSNENHSNLSNTRERVLPTSIINNNSGARERNWNQSFVLNNNHTRGWGITPDQPLPTNTAGANTTNYTAMSETAIIHNQHSTVLCDKCGDTARRLTVRKEGPNTGRTFYSCKPECKFFKWGDENSTERSDNTNDSTNRFGNIGNRGGGGSRGYNSRRGGGGVGRGSAGGSGTDGRGNKRKCGYCRQEGHTRQKCPRINQD